jgi:ABC-type polysaccharide/polyol phosphate transport system ATPase subunit
MTSDIAIQFTEVTLVLPVVRGRRSLRQRAALAKLEGIPVGGRLHEDRKSRIVVTALSGVSFIIRRGDHVGLIGHNGAGKSSMLRVMAGIYHPTHGSCERHGKISTLFSNFLGVHPDASGAENIIFSGLTLGLKRKEIEALAPDIAAFSELGEYIHMPVRTYSSGMRTRLGFSIATAIKPDILLIDEVFGAGDRRFQRKARERMTHTLESANTLVIASHSEEVIRDFCTVAIWLDHGHLRALDSVDSVLAQFHEESDRDAATP